MRVLLTGATGMIGQRLGRELVKSGITVRAIGRSKTSLLSFPAEFYVHDLSHQPLPSDVFDGVDVIVHLAGEPVAQRWNTKVKKRLYTSRVQATQNLLKNLPQGQVRKIISASAIGVFGDTGDQSVDDQSPAGNDFLAKLCQAWEAEVKKEAEKSNTPFDIVRIGIVLAKEGGALTKMLPPFQAGIAGKIGNGSQWMSWIHIEDLIAVFLKLIQSPKAVGCVSAVAPQPVRNEEFTSTLAKVIKRPAVIPVPKIGLKLLYGEMSQVLFSSTKVKSSSLDNLSFQFKFPRLEAALDEILDGCQRGVFNIYSALYVPSSRLKVFAFHQDVRNLEKLMPEEMKFRNVGSLSVVKAGDRVQHQLSVFGVPQSWSTLIVEMEVPEYFIDEQLGGPFAMWRHKHSFCDLAQGTLVIDEIHYKLPFGVIGLLGLPLARLQMQKVFSYRIKKMHEIFK